MKKLYIISIILISLLTVTCAKQKIIISGMATLEQRKSVPSKIDKFETIGYMDTTLALVKGMITGTDSHVENDKIIRTKDILIFCELQLINDYNFDTINIIADINGEFIEYIKPGNYYLKSSFLGFKKILIENISLKSGEIKQVNVNLGYGFGTTIYKIGANNQIIEIQK